MKLTKGLMAVALSLIVASCGTNEENYKRAYDKAKEVEVDKAESTIYTKVREMSRTENVMLGEELVRTNVEYVSAVKDAEFEPEQLKKYNAVVGQFKQLFHAKSMCKRMASGGYDGAIIVATSEPLYYVVAVSSQSLADVKGAVERLAESSPVKLGEGFPWILRAANR